jgi:signal transduction histidine kinase/ActR/RegA family two-component response regulator
MHPMNWKKSMNNTSGRTQHMSLVGQLKRSRLIVVSLIASIFIFSIPVSIIASPSQHNLDVQKGALQEDLNSILISMVNQETGLRGYITTANSAFLQPFTNGRPQYLFAEQRLASQTQGSDFKETAKALAQVDEWANAWYSTYAQVQLHNMQFGQLETARAARTNAFGKALFDQFRTAVAHLQDALGQDLTAIQSRLGILGWVIFAGVVLLAVLAVIVLWRTLSRFLTALRAQLTILISATTLLGSGNLSARIQELAYDELNRLGQTFNTMAQDLEGTTGEVLQQRDELLVLNGTLEEANRARDEFLSTMSHELRTPLASMIGFSQMLLEDAEIANWNQQQQHDLKRILNNGQHLLSLINDVLDLTKIEAGRMALKYSQIDVRELLTSVVEEIQSMALAQHLVLRAELEEGIDFLESNPLKLRQILVNLVSNAIKFTEQGEVTVSATRVISSEQQADQIALAVKDSGMGIPSDVQEHIFEAFYQVDGGYTRKFGGTGLGLSIVSQLTALLGGTIAIKSAPGQGSTFTVTLPIKASHHSIEQGLPRLHAAQPSEASTISSTSDELTPAIPNEVFAVSAQREAPGGQPNLVLAIDDNADTIVLIKAALKDTPYTVVGVQNPLQVMALVQEMRPCAIILDVMMPDLNGWQLLNQLKANPDTSSIPVVVLTVIEEPATGYVLGADEYLIKPFQRDVLLSTLRHVIVSQNGQSQASEREAQPV